MEEPGLQQIIIPAVFMVALLAMFWFIVIRPTQVRQKKHTDLISSLMPGDRIVTVGGIYAKVHKVSEKSIDVEISEGTVVTMDRRAIRRLQDQEDF